MKRASSSGVRDEAGQESWSACAEGSGHHPPLPSPVPVPRGGRGWAGGSAGRPPGPPPEASFVIRAERRGRAPHPAVPPPAGARPLSPPQPGRAAPGGSAPPQPPSPGPAPVPAPPPLPGRTFQRRRPAGSPPWPRRAEPAAGPRAPAMELGKVVSARPRPSPGLIPGIRGRFWGNSISGELVTLGSGGSRRNAAGSGDGRCAGSSLWRCGAPRAAAAGAGSLHTPVPVAAPSRRLAGLRPCRGHRVPASTRVPVRAGCHVPPAPVLTHLCLRAPVSPCPALSQLLRPLGTAPRPGRRNGNKL